MRAMHFFVKQKFEQVLRHARGVARLTPGREICGLLIDTGGHLAFVETRNAFTSAGSFVLPRRDVRLIAAAANVLGLEIVGTFHSHPVGEAKPGKSDIEHALDDSLMLIFDCIGREGRLWKIRNGKARRVPFDFL